MPRVVLDARAEPDLTHHLDVVAGAHPQPLRLQQLALILQVDSRSSSSSASMVEMAWAIRSGPAT